MMQNQDGVGKCSSAMRGRSRSWDDEDSIEVFDELRIWRGEVEGSRDLRYGVWGSDDSEWIQSCIERYSENFVPRFRGTGNKSEGCEERIPRIIHHIWIGGKLPGKFQSLRDEWILLHPAQEGWKHYLWDDESIAQEFSSNPMDSAGSYASASNYGEKSDILRLEVLNRFGGVYVDVDFKCIRSFHDILGLSNVGHIEVNNGLIGSAPQHPLLKVLPLWHLVPSTSMPSDRLLCALSSGNETICKTGTKFVNSFKLDRQTGPGYFTRMMISAWKEKLHKPHGVDDLEWIVLPVRYFYSLPNNHGDFEKNWQTIDLKTVQLNHHLYHMTAHRRTITLMSMLFICGHTLGRATPAPRTKSMSKTNKK
ncbi:hypothetical protein GUITHDRAFT_110904 [Guillardia theta CCMP2712]|uniref:Alpha 1,4-glycosyltransferase domain-containing protein n=1 Tax=Guillardia theta (strain CCMP2712) TaxID=905079 RepID=L1J4C0_GUITC|nr:hypothetical protein GUITHDRAFT_110904 [Guillardia theta CCMP2712]EKX43177.1 hypothetical protein GUITHDRAFT_110904 [Guillardia theta CCMP2712]|eukprot:XP_005830157.1 hypothetical protein GUITHDRAFT_110904 [Guillardia theta CCMP2712]